METETPTAIISNQTAKLNAALAKAQGVFSVPVKNRLVKVYSKPPERKHLYDFWYADLSSIHEATRKGLADNGLSHTHTFSPAGSGWFQINTSLRHESGEILESILPFKIDTPKETAAIISYWRRYSLGALLGVASEEDTDGGVEGDQSADFKDKEPKGLKPSGAPSVITPPSGNPKKPNKAPFNQIFDSLKPPEDIPDVPMPDYENESQQEFPLLDQLAALAEEKKLSNREIYQLAGRVLGGPVEKIRELSHADLSKVVAFVKTYVSPKKPE